MNLPESGWKGYGAPQHPRTRIKPLGDFNGVMRIEMDAEIAEYRLKHQGIRPELLAYLRGIGESVR